MESGWRGKRKGFGNAPFQHVDLEAPEVVCGILLSPLLGNYRAFHPLAEQLLRTGKRKAASIVLSWNNMPP